MAATHAAAFGHARPWSGDEFAGLLQNPACFASGDRRCFALLRVIGHEVELLTIAIHPDHRRQGLARARMTAWQAEAHARGATRAFLEVAADNPAAIGLYRSCGFAASGLRQGYYRRAGTKPIDAVVMARQLSPVLSRLP